MKIAKKDQILFALDLDGTLLTDSANHSIHPENIPAVLRATKLGHKVCILTGRPWRATKMIYQKLKLKTAVVNYNGAYIHNPNPETEFLPVIRNMDLNDVLYVLGDEILKKAISNIAIEGPGWVNILKRESKLEEVFGINLSRNIKVGLDLSRIPLKPTGVIVDTKKNVDGIALAKYLKRRYGDLGEFTSWSKGKNESSVVDMTAPNAKKNTALILLARYYDISINRTIALGDGFNDIEMLQAAGMGVAMLNAGKFIKNIAQHFTDYDNEHGGVGRFINKILDNFEYYSDTLNKMEIDPF